jgi:glutamate dehydrogenase
VLPEVDCRRFGQAVDDYRERGIELGVARRLAGLPYLFPACEVIAVADEVGTGVATAGRTYFALDSQLHLGRLRRLMERLSPRNQWERIAVAGLYEDMTEEHRRLTIQAFAASRVRPHVDDGPEAVQEAVGEWLTSDVAGFGRWQRLLSELDSQAGADLAMIAVAMRALAFLDATAASAA